MCLPYRRRVPSDTTPYPFPGALTLPPARPCPPAGATCATTAAKPALSAPNRHSTTCPARSGCRSGWLPDLRQAETGRRGCVSIREKKIRTLLPADRPQQSESAPLSAPSSPIPPLTNPLPARCCSPHPGSPAARARGGEPTREGAAGLPKVGGEEAGPPSPTTSLNMSAMRCIESSSSAAWAVPAVLGAAAAAAAAEGPTA